jgi:hypothetical protein
MTNQTIDAAVTAVRATSELASQLATAAPTEATTNCGITEDNTNFTESVNSAEAAVQLAMDEEEAVGQVLTALDFALDELRLARQAFFTPVSRNRVNAAIHVDNALCHMESRPVGEPS